MFGGAPDGFKAARDDPLRPEHGVLDRLLAGWLADEKTDLGPVLEADREAQARFFRAVLERMRPLLRADLLQNVYWPAGAPRRKRAKVRSLALLRHLLERLAKRKLPVAEADVARLLELRTPIDWHSDCPLSWGATAGYVARWARGRELPAAVRDRIAAGIDALAGWDYHTIVAVRRRLHGLLEEPEADDTFRLRSEEPWALAIRDGLEGAAGAWVPLLRHAATARATRPSKKWLKDARACIEALGADEVRARLTAWLTQGQQGGLFARDEDADTLKGLVWIAGAIPLPALLGDLGIFAFKKVPGWGARSAKIGNACIGALGGLDGLEGAAQLARLRQRVRYPSARTLVEKALDATAERLGLARVDVEEMSVPHFGFDADGSWEVELGDARARVRLVSAIDPQLSWESGGKVRKGVPAAVKRDHAEALKELKAEVRELKKMLPAQRDRLEAMLLEPRAWDEAAWRERYADHPLLRHAARRLLWWCGDATAGFLGDALVDAEDRPVRTGGPVSLWSPIGRPVDEIRAWREWLERHEITQPFKQAHREIYLLTPAERETGTYSNRFAGHMLKQHQLAALCRQRGWDFTLIGQWDSLNYPTKDLPGGWRADYAVDSVEFDAPVSEAGIYLYVATDRVSFHRGNARRAAPLADVPPHVFSEVMRDVDLFVGVASLGNDPEWADRGAHPAFGDYWQDYSFGKLTESGKSRREILERLLPRLKIADRCTISGRYLEVKGAWKTYRIHLGSGNILMEPGSEYLCIVPGSRGRGGPQGLFLPFEGDQRLAVILSKAFLLADDAKIKDPTILAQIRRS